MSENNGIIMGNFFAAAPDGVQIKPCAPLFFPDADGSDNPLISRKLINTFSCTSSEQCMKRRAIISSNQVEDNIHIEYLFFLPKKGSVYFWVTSP